MPRFSLLPNQTRFFDLFESASTNLLEGARLLQNLFDHYTEVERQVAQITLIEQKGDHIVHEVTSLANVSLIAPIDHEDAQQLIFALDDALDAIEEAVVRMVIYQVEQPTETARNLVAVIHRSAEELNAIMPALRSRKETPKIHAHIVQINGLEYEGDLLLYEGLKDLVRQRESMFDLIRWKEIYERLESVTDRMEDVGDVLERILIRNA